MDIILGEEDTAPYAYDHFAADANQDGAITITDVMSIVDMVLLLEE